MQLVFISVVGLGRLSDASMKVRGKVTAVVGPNEAGKSTLLRGLASLSSDTPFAEGAAGEIPRRTSPQPADAALEVTFALSADDQQAMADIPSEIRPEFLTATKTYGGAVEYRMDTLGRRVRAPRQAAADAVASMSSALEQVDDSASDEVREQRAQLLARTRSAHAVLTDVANPGTLSAASLGLLAEVRDELGSASAELVSGLESVIAAFDAMLDSELAEHPSERMLSLLTSRAPEVALFGEDDRALAYEYNLEGMTGDSVPAALHNLAVSAKLEMAAMLADFAAGRWDALAEHIADANDELASLFSASWTAGSGTAAVHLDRDATTLRVMVTSKVGRFSPVTERSDGLRMFVALTTFVQARTGGSRPVVLLIDEAENHLHYDAQADLMGVLARQELASQIIYTTHSAGCLPDELGGNIVAVVPNPMTGLSTINSSYWTRGSASRRS